MANPTPPLPTPRAAPRPPGRVRRALWWLALAMLGFVVVTQGAALGHKAQTGAAFAARMGCSCRYVEGRPPGQCRDDFEPGMHFIWMSADDESRTVTARIPLLASARAAWRAGAGCQLEAWRD